MPAKQTAGRAETARLVSTQPIHIAWGTGKAAWDTTPEPEPTDDTALIAEVGRRAATEVGFVLPDDNGPIETPQGNFKKSDVPTRWLYIRVLFAFDEASDKRIRELGIFVGTKTKAGLPAGQKYFKPDELEAGGAGQLYLLDRSQRFDRNGAVRPAFEYVLPF